jgi:hypothetical protein
VGSNGLLAFRSWLGFPVEPRLVFGERDPFGFTQGRLFDCGFASPFGEAKSSLKMTRSSQVCPFDSIRCEPLTLIFSGL